MNGEGGGGQKCADRVGGGQERSCEICPFGRQKFFHLYPPHPFEERKEGEAEEKKDFEITTSVTEGGKNFGLS